MPHAAQTVSVLSRRIRAGWRIWDILFPSFPASSLVHHWFLLRPHDGHDPSGLSLTAKTRRWRVYNRVGTVSEGRWWPFAIWYAATAFVALLVTAHKAVAATEGGIEVAGTAVIIQNYRIFAVFFSHFYPTNGLTRSETTCCLWFIAWKKGLHR